MSERNTTLGWGLIGPGRFAREFASELSQVPDARLAVVASRDEARARDFAGEFGFERAVGSYDALMEDETVDVVYIVVQHVFHRELAEQALEAGKAVVCEKPLTPTLRETRSLIDIAREREVFLMEAMKTGFLPAVRKARQWIEEGAIGAVRLAKADFCFQGSTDPEDRLMNPELGGGAVLDVGIYPIHFTRFLLGEVVEIHACGTKTATGVEDSAAILTKHESGAGSVMTCSFCTEEAMDASVLGTEGEIRIPTFHKGNRVERWKDGECVDVFESPEAGMVRAEIEAAQRSIRAGRIECEGHSHEDSLRLAELLEEVRTQVGIVPS